MKSKKWLSFSCNILLNILFFPAVFYLSLSLEAFLQIRKAELFEYQYIPFSSKEDNIYSFRKSLYFTPEIAEYLSDGGRLYLYLRKEAVGTQKIQNIQVEVIRTNHGETKTYYFDQSNAENAISNYQRSGFHSLAFPNVKLHIDYNGIQVKIQGIKLNDPAEDINVLLAFSGIKRRIKWMTYLLFGGGCAVGWGIVFALCLLIRRKRINRSNLV